MKHTTLQHDGAPHPLLAVMAREGRRHAWLAEGVGCSRSHLSLVLHGKRPASRRMRQAILAFFPGRTEAELFHGTPARIGRPRTRGTGRAGGALDIADATLRAAG